MPKWLRPNHCRLVSGLLVIFRFHDHFPVCAQRIAMLREMNPGVVIIGFYGGPKSNWATARKMAWDDCYLLRDKIDLWKWQYADIHLRKWFKRHGQRQQFSHVCLYEWDLVVTKPLVELYPATNADLLTTGLKSIAQRRREGWPWLVEPYLAPERQQFEQWAQRKLRWDGDAQIGLLPGARVSRKFLEAYAGVRPPRGGNDELRLGILASAFGMRHEDTGFGNRQDFNCDRREIPPGNCLAAATDPGRNVFHPVYQRLPLPSE